MIFEDPLNEQYLTRKILWMFKCLFPPWLLWQQHCSLGCSGWSSPSRDNGPVGRRSEGRSRCFLLIAPFVPSISWNSCIFWRLFLDQSHMELLILDSLHWHINSKALSQLTTFWKHLETLVICAGVFIDNNISHSFWDFHHSTQYGYTWMNHVFPIKAVFTPKVNWFWGYFLDALASLKPHYWSKFPHFFRLLR